MMQSVGMVRWAWAAGLFGLAGCVGTIAGPGEPGREIPDPDQDPDSVAAPDWPGMQQPLPPVPLRRLTRREYNNTIRDLTGDRSAPADKFPRDVPGEHGYESPGAIGTIEAENYMAAAEAVSLGALSRLTTLLPCSPKAATEEVPCASQFIQVFGSRAFRRPLRPAEAADLLVLFSEVRQNARFSFEESIAAVIQGILQSPSFLYHREMGTDEILVDGDLVRLTNHELASQLSYFITGTMPDSELLQAAADGVLVDDRVVEQQARRLAADHAALGKTLADFVAQWLGLETDHLEKNEEIYPGFTANIKPRLAEEVLRFVTHLVESASPATALLTDTSLFVDPSTAKLYGVAAPTSGAFANATGNPDQRAGILTQLAFLSVHANPGGSHPMKRAHILFDNVLCGEVPPPPPDVPVISAPVPGQTTRERFEAHAEAACATCHRLMDPFGFALESYDGIGRFRTSEEGKVLDTSGIATLPLGGEVEFSSAVDLMTKLAATADVTTCLARQLARYGARAPRGPDEAVATQVLESIGADRTLADFMVAVATARAFRWRKPATGEVL